jgi:hypothetical protein
MHARPLLCTLAASAVVAALAVPGSAFAQTLTHLDATHDAQRFDLSTGHITKASHTKKVDIVRSRLSYTNQALKTTVWLRTGKVGNNWLMVGAVHTGATHFEWDASQSPSGKVVTLEDANGAQVGCKGLAVRVRHTSGRLTMTVPASCLARPGVVRAGVLFSIQTNDTTLYADDGLQRRGMNLKGAQALSRKLHRDR